MTKNHDSNIEQLKSYLTRQLEAYLHNDWPVYSQLEEEIIKIEKKI